jgi:hypothetical protein
LFDGHRGTVQAKCSADHPNVHSAEGLAKTPQRVEQLVRQVPVDVRLTEIVDISRRLRLLPDRPIHRFADHILYDHVLNDLLTALSHRPCDTDLRVLIGIRILIEGVFQRFCDDKVLYSQAIGIAETWPLCNRLSSISKHLRNDFQFRNNRADRRIAISGRQNTHEL